MSINTLVNITALTYPRGWAYVRGTMKPGLEVAIRLEDVTAGFVRARDWLQPYSESEPAHQKKKTNKKPHTHKD